MRLPRKKTLLLAALALVCAVAAHCLQPRRTDDASTEGDLIVAGLGGFRGLIAEVVWFRADRLQDEGRFAELAQLATTLTLLEPKNPEVWTYAAWNLAYNVSVAMPDAPERWRWVKAAIALLRDDGLRVNPTEPQLYRELAWMYLAKIGGTIDDAAPYYVKAWRAEVDAAAQRGAWRELGFESAFLKTVRADYGLDDPAHPLAAALYWARRGLLHARRAEDRRDLNQIVWQALMLLSRENRRYAPKALAEMRRARAEHPSPMLDDLVERFAKTFGLAETSAASRESEKP